MAPGGNQEPTMNTLKIAVKLAFPLFLLYKFAETLLALGVL